MATVTVLGAHGHHETLDFDTAANAQLALKLAAAITAAVEAHQIIPATSADGPPPTVPSGATGEFIQAGNGVTFLPPGYKAVVDVAQQAVIFGSGDNDESVLSSTGNLTFVAPGGSGTVVSGGGNNNVIITPTVAGAWSVNTGKGDDNIFAFGSGNDTVSAGGGHNHIVLGSGNNLVISTGDDAVFAGSGHETITASDKARDVVYGNASQLFFVASDASATVFGGSGSDTFFGGTGSDLVYGGSAGKNLLTAGTGGATLFGGGDGDTLFGGGSKAQVLHAGAGNETLIGGAGNDTFYGGSGTTRIIGGAGDDTFVGSTGTASIDAGVGKNLFLFAKGQAGGKDTITGFVQGRDHLDLQGYGKNAIADALKSQVVANGSDTITLSDHTTITFANIKTLSASDFITGNTKQLGSDRIASDSGPQGQGSSNRATMDERGYFGPIRFDHT